MDKATGKSGGQLDPEQKERTSSDLATAGQKLKNAMADKMNAGGKDTKLKEVEYDEHLQRWFDVCKSYKTKYPKMNGPDDPDKKKVSSVHVTIKIPDILLCPFENYGWRKYPSL